MAIADRVTELVVPLLEPLELQLYDVELNGGTLRVTVDAPGGVNLDRLAEATRAISHAFDEADPMPGKYTLEVSSPGLERRLRTPQHFLSAVGEEISVKLGPHVEGERRVSGALTAVEDGVITVTGTDDVARVLALVDVTKAATVFHWGPSPRPGQPKAKNSKTKQAGSSAANPPESERTASAR